MYQSMYTTMTNTNSKFLRRFPYHLAYYPAHLPVPMSLCRNVMTKILMSVAERKAKSRSPWTTSVPNKKTVLHLPIKTLLNMIGTRRYRNVIPFSHSPWLVVYCTQEERSAACVHDDGCGVTYVSM